MARPRFPEPVERVLAAYNLLPGVGPKTALRYMYATLAWSNQDRAALATALLDLNKTLLVCRSCRTLSDRDPCVICADEKRDASLLCVVAEPQDLIAVESTGAYQGKYFVLGGTLSPLSGRRAEDLPLPHLLDQMTQRGAKEVILALDPDTEGEATTLYLTKLLKPHGAIVSRLGRGMPVGGDLEYADTLTLTDALNGRKTLS